MHAVQPWAWDGNQRKSSVKLKRDREISSDIPTHSDLHTSALPPPLPVLPAPLTSDSLSEMNLRFFIRPIGQLCKAVNSILNPLRMILARNGVLQIPLVHEWVHEPRYIKPDGLWDLGNINIHRRLQAILPRLPASATLPSIRARTSRRRRRRNQAESTREQRWAVSPNGALNARAVRRRTFTQEPERNGPRVFPVKPPVPPLTPEVTNDALPSFPTLLGSTQEQVIKKKKRIDNPGNLPFITRISFTTWWTN